MAPLVKALTGAANIESRVCVTAQHRQMLDQVLEFFEIEADYDLNLMKPGQDLFSLTSAIILGMKPVLEELAKHNNQHIRDISAFPSKILCDRDATIYTDITL